MAATVTFKTEPTTNFFSFTKTKETAQKKQIDPSLEDRYEILRTRFEEIELPHRFNAQQLVDAIKEDDQKHPEGLEDILKMAEIHNKLGYFQSGIQYHLSHKTTDKDFPKIYWGFLETLGKFNEQILESINDKRNGWAEWFYDSDLPSNFFTSVDLSLQTEEISTEVFLQIISDIKAQTIKSVGFNSKMLEKKFLTAVKRVGKTRISKILKAYSKIVDDVFEKMNLLETNRFKLREFIFFWNIPGGRIDFLDVELDKISCKLLDQEFYERYYTAFNESLKEARKYFISNFKEIFRKSTDFKNKDMKVTWNEMIDTIVYA